MNPITFQQLIESFETPEEAAKYYENIHKLYRQLRKQDIRLFNDFHPIGFAFFSNEIMKRNMLRLLEPHVVKMLKWESWQIKMKNQQDIKTWQNIFRWMKEAQITFMQIPGLKMPRILKMISHVGFFELTHLNLHGCGIQNIESLSFIDAPNLKILNMIYNNVYEYKSLKKVNFRLNKLFLYSREITQNNKEMPFVKLDDSSRWDFLLESLRLEKYSYHEIISQDLSFLNKMKINENQSLVTHISIQRRIFQNKLFQNFSMKNILLTIFHHPRQELNNPQILNLFDIQRR